MSEPRMVSIKVGFEISPISELRPEWRETLKYLVGVGRTVYVDKDRDSKRLYLFLSRTSATAFIIKPKKKP